jgi:hypothetical protein
MAKQLLISQEGLRSMELVFLISYVCIYLSVQHCCVFVLHNYVPILTVCTTFLHDVKFS